MTPTMDLATALLERSYRLELAARLRGDLQGGFDDPAAKRRTRPGNVISLVVNNEAPS